VKAEDKQEKQDNGNLMVIIVESLHERLQRCECLIEELIERVFIECIQPKKKKSCCGSQSKKRSKKAI